MSTNLITTNNEEYEIPEINSQGSNVPDIRITQRISADAERSGEKKNQCLVLDENGKNVRYVNDVVELRNNSSPQKCADFLPEPQNKKCLSEETEDKDAKYLSLLPDDKDAKYLSLLPDDKNAKYLSLLLDDKNAKYLSLMTEDKEGYEGLSNKPDVSCKTGRACEAVGAGGTRGIQQRQLPPTPNCAIYETIKHNNQKDYEDYRYDSKRRAAAVRLFLKNRCNRCVGVVCVIIGLTVILLVFCLLYYYLKGQSQVFCYYTGQAQSRPGQGRFVPEDIDVTLCTHLIFRYAKIENGRINYTQVGDDEKYPKSGLYERFNALKQKNRRLRTLLSVGGNSPVQAQDEFKRIHVLNELSSFVRVAITFLRDNGFDGIDFRWLYPTLSSSDAERYIYTQWLQEIRKGFDEEKRLPGDERLLLMATVSPGKFIIDNVYNVPRISDSLDYLNLLGYNIHQAAEDNVTAHHSPLYASRNNTLIKHKDELSHITLSQAWALNYWLQKGAPREKLVLAFGFSSPSFTLASASDHSLGAPSFESGAPGRVNNRRGALAYYEVCENLDAGWESVYDEVQQAVYSFKGDQWVSYENERSIAVKTKYVRDLQIAGVSIVSVDLDDFSGAFCHRGRFPLLSTISRILL